jgi:hypothetical protein
MGKAEKKSPKPSYEAFLPLPLHERYQLCKREIQRIISHCKKKAIDGQEIKDFSFGLSYIFLHFSLECLTGIARGKAELNSHTKGTAKRKGSAESPQPNKSNASPINK